MQLLYPVQHHKRYYDSNQPWVLSHSLPQATHPTPQENHRRRAPRCRTAQYVLCALSRREKSDLFHIGSPDHDVHDHSLLRLRPWGHHPLSSLIYSQLLLSSFLFFSSFTLGLTFLNLIICFLLLFGSLFLLFCCLGNALSYFMREPLPFFRGIL